MNTRHPSWIKHDSILCNVTQNHCHWSQTDCLAPKMHLDVVSLDDVQADTNHTHWNIANGPSHFPQRSSWESPTRSTTSRLDATTLHNVKADINKSDRNIAKGPSHHPQGRKPVAWEPKMHLDAITLDDVKADTKQSDKNIANQLPGNPKCTLTPSLTEVKEDTNQSDSNMTKRPSHFAWRSSWESPARSQTSCQETQNAPWRRHSWCRQGRHQPKR